MSRPSSLWSFVQRRFPGVAARIRATRAARSAGAPPTVEMRLHRLEEELDLMAHQLAALTAQLGYGESSGPVDADIEARVNAARLAALAFYEARIEELEERRDD